MRPRKFSLRVLISILMAVVFVIAVEPGVMAMPAPQAMKMDCSGKAAPACDHMKAPKDTGTPCKNMSICVGMLNCFGMAAVAADHPSPLAATARATVPFLQQTASGLTLQPDNPPPIA
jgi:hypothetical protein